MSSLASVNPFFASADDVEAFVHNDTVLALCAEAYETILSGYEILMTSRYEAEELRGEAEMLAGEETLVTYMAKELTVRDTTALGASRPWMALAPLVDDMRSGEPDKLVRAAAVLAYFSEHDYPFDDALDEACLDTEEREYFCALFCGVTPSVYAIGIALVYKAAEMLNDPTAFDALLDKYEFLKKI
jgi:hypothetical protein